MPEGMARSVARSNRASLGVNYALIAAADHAVDELVFEEMNRAVVAEGRHGAAQPVGLVGGEFGGIDGDPQRA